MYHSRVIKMPRSVPAIICSTVLPAGVMKTIWSAPRPSHSARESRGCHADLADLIFVLRLAHLRRGVSRVNKLANHALFHQAHALTINAFPIERRIGLERMCNIVDDRNIFTKKLVPIRLFRNDR